MNKKIGVIGSVINVISVLIFAGIYATLILIVYFTQCR